MIEELRAILELLGDVTGIAGWLFGAWLIFKVVILLSTTGSVVYLTKIGFDRLYKYLELSSNNAVKKETISKQEKIKDVEIKGICITSDGTYEHVVNTLKIVKNHMGTVGSSYIHKDGADWLADAVAEKIDRERSDNNN